MNRLIASLLVLGLLVGCGSRNSLDGGVFNPDTAVPIDVSAWEGLVDAGTLRYLVELGKAKRCEAADLDGDGVRETLCLRSADGTQTWIQETNGGPLDFKIEHFADGRVRYTYWYQNYGAPAIVDEEFPDGHRITEFDSDHDRAFERRIDEFRDGGDIEATEYFDAGASDAGPGGLVVSRRWVRAASSDQGTHVECDGNTNFPTEFGLWQGGSPPGFSNHPNVKCDPARSKKLGAAFECARKKLDCVGRTNSSMKKQVEAHLLGDDLQYGCNNPCTDALASTLPAFGPYKGQTNFNGSRLDTWSADEACSTVLHELMHLAKAEQGAHHEDGIDPIYSCARYCVGCINFGGFGAGTPFPSDNLDCVHCAGSTSEKKSCGIKTELKSAACPDNAFCHGGVGVNARCETCENSSSKTCEGTAVGSEDFNCCKTCPADAPKNDRLCPGPYRPSDTCSSKPPECP